MTAGHLLVCTDLDRTLIPNGDAAEQRTARPRFTTLAQRPDVTLAYVTGRHLALVEEAIDGYGLPIPDYIISDVGTQIYAHTQQGWEHWTAWDDEIGGDWNGHEHADLATLLENTRGLRLQEKEKQNIHKLSYYTPENWDVSKSINQISSKLGSKKIKINLIWSVDEQQGVGLLDILPESATKLHALRFLQRQLGFERRQTVFAGDSGNDLDVLASEIPAVLVANASDEVRQQARGLANRNGQVENLYCAAGSEALGLNGNYAAGILEGIAHYHPGMVPAGK